MKLLLVAKPWKGGLADYVLRAMRAVDTASVEYIPTYPRTLSERMDFLRDKYAWRSNLVEKINAKHYDAAIFINHLSMFRGLKNPDKNVLWLTDGPKLNVVDVQPFGRIFLSDPGYVDSLPADAKYQGELPFAHDPAIHRPYPDTGRKQGLCFIANRDPKRDAWLAQLSAAGVMPKVYGNYFFRHPLFWKAPGQFRPSISPLGMGRIYARYQVALNIHAAVVREGTNMRTFECAGYEVPQLVEYRTGLERFFEPEREILVFSSAQECLAQYERLQQDRKYAARLAENAKKRVRAEHTYTQRVATMLHGLIQE
jgi:hypothetical protein